MSGVTHSILAENIHVLGAVHNQALPPSFIYILTNPNETLDLVEKGRVESRL